MIISFALFIMIYFVFYSYLCFCFIDNWWCCSTCFVWSSAWCRMFVFRWWYCCVFLFSWNYQSLGSNYWRMHINHSSQVRLILPVVCWHACNAQSKKLLEIVFYGVMECFIWEMNLIEIKVLVYYHILDVNNSSK